MVSVPSFNDASTVTVQNLFDFNVNYNKGLVVNLQGFKGDVTFYNSNFW